MTAHVEDRWRFRKEASPNTAVLKSDPYFDPDEGECVEFRLTYEGLLLATQHDPVKGQADARAPHKVAIRRHFHLQLKRLWEINPFLKHGEPVTFDWQQKSSPKGGVTYGCSLIDYLAPLYVRNKYRCVPLVRSDLSLICSLEILFLRPDPPGSILQSGDIDNRIKTLFDALRLPKGAQEIVGYDSPKDDEDPFFCLLEDDGLITHVSVETDVLLQPTGLKFDMNDTRLIITVRIRPYNAAPNNQFFG